MADELFDLHGKNIPGVKFEHDRLSFFYRIFLLTGLPEGTPTYIYLGNGPINQLHDIRFTESEVQMLNEKGLHFYLWEPLCLYREDDDGHTQGFYSEFSINYIDSLYKAWELDSISYFAYANNLTNVTVHTCDYNCEMYFTYYTNLKVVCEDLFLKSFVMFNNIKEKSEIERKFLCLNWRYTKSRHLTMLHLFKKSGYYSWYFNSTENNLQKNLWFDIKSNKGFKHILENIKELDEVSPLKLDLPNNNKTDISGLGHYWPDDIKMVPVDNRLNTDIQEFYDKTFVTVVTETRFAQPTGNFSEKTFYAMKYMKPFIVVAPPYTLEYIRKTGFKTFNDFWDESYDTIEDHEERMLAIYKLIDHIDSMSIEELKELNNKMQRVLRYNYNRLIYFTFDKRLQEVPK